MTLSAYLATAYLGDDDLYSQTNTGILVRTHFYAPSSIGSVVVTSLSPCRGQSLVGEK